MGHSQPPFSASPVHSPFQSWPEFNKDAKVDVVEDLRQELQLPRHEKRHQSASPSPNPEHTQRCRGSASNEGSFTPLAPTPASARDPIPSDAWRLRGICWMFLLKNLPWVAVVFTTVFSLIPDLLFVTLMDGRVVGFKVYDANLTFPIVPPFIPTALGYIMPATLFAISVGLGELALHRKQHRCLTNVISVALFFFVQCACCTCTAYLVTEVTKRTVGKPRPNFLAICQPGEIKFPTQVGFNYNNGTEQACTNPDRAAVADARLSFPSRLATLGSSIAMYSIVYSFWTLYCRKRRSVFVTARSWTDAVIRDVFHFLGFFWICIQVGMIWVVGVCRVVDFRHHPVDVTAGILMGGILGTLWGLFSINSSRFLPVYNPSTKQPYFPNGTEA